MPLVYESELLTPRGVLLGTPRGAARRGDAVPGDDAHDIQNSGREHLESLVCLEGLEVEEDFLEEGDDDCKITVIIGSPVPDMSRNKRGYLQGSPTTATAAFKDAAYYGGLCCVRACVCAACMLVSVQALAARPT